jgi:hypothetical protein
VMASIELPQPIAERLEKLVQRYSAIVREDMVSTRRMVEITLVQRGIAALETELEVLIAAAKKPERVA